MNHEPVVGRVETNQKSVLHQVTPLSKYLAMALFIFLPFVGGWIGYTYTPEKVVEVEKVLVKEIESDTIASDGSLSLERKTSNSIAETVAIFEEQTIALDTVDYLGGVLKFSIIVQKRIGDNTLFMDLLSFDKETGLVSIQYENGMQTELMRLHKLAENDDLEERIENIVLFDNEPKRDQYIQEGLQSIGGDSSELTFRMVCTLLDRDEYQEGDLLSLTYDTNLYREVSRLSFGPGGPCGRNRFIVLDDLLIESYSFPIDAEEPKIDNSSIKLDTDISPYRNTRTGDLVYKYDFLETD